MSDLELYAEFCDRYEDAYQEFLEANELKDTLKNQEEFALSRAGTLADFEASYLEDLELTEADNFNDWAKAEGA